MKTKTVGLKPFVVIAARVMVALALAAPVLVAPVMAATSATANTAALPLPQVVGPIPVTETSRPFLGASAAMAAVDYVEEEFFMSGQANVYDWEGPDHKLKVIAGPGQYTTRILVRRPRDPAKFSGNVEMTILNATLRADFGGFSNFDEMVKQGDVWIGITSKPLTARALQHFDPVRYAPLDWSNPAPVEKRCSAPSIIPTYMMTGYGPLVSKSLLWLMSKTSMAISFPETEDGLVWDMLGQLGLLLKSEERNRILPGFSKPWVYMTGISQSSIVARTWAKFFHDRYRTPDGGPIYDGYLAIVGPSLARINQCSAEIAFDDPAQKLAAPEVPFIALSSESEMWQARYTHQPDAFSPKGGIVTYEVAGASHRRHDIPGLTPDRITRPPAEDLIKAGVTPPKTPAADDNDLVWTPIIRGAFHNLELWARQGVRPPQAPGIEIGADFEVKRDRFGNALGGIRMPYIEAPVATHTGYTSTGGMGGIEGTKKLFSPATLKQLYPDHGAYVAKFSNATDRLLNGRWISAADAAAMKKDANSANVPE